MSLFDSLKGPKWRHENPQVRSAAVAQLDDQDVLLEIVNTDPDAMVQAAALARIDRPEILDRLLETLPQGLQQQARRQRLQLLLPSPDGLAAIEDEAVLLRIVGLADDAALCTAAVARITNAGVLLDIASGHAVAKVRLSAAAGISDMALLGELMQRARGHDKAVFRHCKERLDEYQARQLAAEERQQKILRLVAQAGELAVAADAPDYELRCRSLEQQWQVLEAAASPQEQARFQEGLAICRQRLAQLAGAKRDEALAEAELRAAGKALDDIIAELEQIDALDALPQDQAGVAELGQRLDDIEHRWIDAQGRAQASAEQLLTGRKHLERWRSMLRTLRRLHETQAQLDKILHAAEGVDRSDYQALKRQCDAARKAEASLPWPDSHPACLPAPIARLREVLAQLEERLGALDKEQEKLVERLQAMLARLRSELEQNHSREAGRALSKARRIFKSLAPARHQQFEQEIQPLAARLQEVQDWQAFAIEPKKVELCSRMRNLVGSDEDAEIVAGRIRSLQQQWRQLGGLPHAREQALWNEFKAAADEAWKPCKEAFAQKAALYRQNYEKRMRLVAQLSEYEEKMAWPARAGDAAGQTDGSAAAPPDWRLVQKTLDAARAAFRDIKPVDQKAERRSYKALRAVCDRIYSHIKDEYERNITRKEQLVNRAQALATVDDLKQAAEVCKQLQREWKEIGITPVSTDRKLWKALRAACDAVFARMDQQRVESKAEADAQLAQADALRAQGRALLESAGEEQALQLPKALAELQQQALGLGLSAGVQQRLARDFQAMEQQARHLAIEIRHRRENAGWARLLEKIHACALKQVDDEAAGRKWQAAGELPRGIDEQALEAFWQQGPSEGAAEQLRESCVALEIFGGVDSPAEDKAVRMNYQMRRLAAGMGRRNEQPDPTLEEHINAFIALRPSREWAERFCSTVEKIRA